MPEAAAGTDGKPAAKVGVTIDPYRNYNFLLQVQDVAEAKFVECSGLGMRVHPIRYRESGSGQIVRVMPGLVEYDLIKLRYGLTNSLELWNWLMAVVKGTVTRRHVSIVMLDLDGAREAFRWNLINAWPCEWRGAALDALGREAAIEEMHLAYDSLDRS